MKKISLIAIAIVGFFTIGTAAVPVTMTNFHSVYNYLMEVSHVVENGVIDGRTVSFLVDENNPIDQKAAIINGLVTNNKTKSNALTFKQFVARKYGENWENLDLNKLSGDELFCLGYITIIDGEGNSEDGLTVLNMAVQKSPNSYTINLIHALAVAQSSINNGNDCEGWKTCNSVKTNTTLNNDLNSGISSLIFDVMESYNNNCQ